MWMLWDGVRCVRQKINSDLAILYRISSGFSSLEQWVGLLSREVSTLVRNASWAEARQSRLKAWMQMNWRETRQVQDHWLIFDWCLFVPLFYFEFFSQSATARTCRMWKADQSCARLDSAAKICLNFIQFRLCIEERWVMSWHHWSVKPAF
jgi:hypothetical protein